LEVDTAKANEVRQYGYSKRCTWREVYLALDTRTRQVQAALMTHHDVADGNVLAKSIDLIPADERFDSARGDGAYDSKPCHAARGRRSLEGDRVGRRKVQRSERRDRTARPPGMEEGLRRLLLSFVGRECDASAQNVHGFLPVGTPNRLAGGRRRDPRGRTQSHD
jgi:hypothetical protein